MSVRIIDCHDPELTFHPRNGRPFRCFYVCPDDGGQTGRLFVTVQPDRTAQVVKLEPQPSNTPELKQLIQISSRPSADWSKLILAACECLETEPVTAVYSLLQNSDDDWRNALATAGFEAQGRVQTLSSKLSADRTNHRRLAGGHRIVTLSASAFRSMQNGGDGTYDDLTQQVVELLNNTIQHSEDCLLRTQLEAENVLALFAYNPGALKILLAKSRSVLTGLLVVNDSPGPNCGHIEYVGVHSDHRRQCVASSLLSEFQSRFFGAELTVAVHESNAASLAYFRSMGFGITGHYLLWTMNLPG